MNKEQIIKALNTLKYGGHSCTNCKDGITKGEDRCGLKGCKIARDALALIKDQDEQIFKLENRLKECENGYQGTLFLDRCKLHDAEEKIKEQENVIKNLVERIQKANGLLEALRNDILEAITETARGATLEIAARVKGLFSPDDDIQSEIDKIAIDIVLKHNYTM